MMAAPAKRDCPKDTGGLGDAQFSSLSKFTAMPEGPLSLYRARLREGVLHPDADQELAMEKLQGLAHALAAYRPRSPCGGWRERLGLARRADPAPQGLYLFGGVGRGKTMLMEMFFDTAPMERKRRVHFHAFMLEVHERLHLLRAEARGKRKGGDEAVGDLARLIAEEAWLLCFDEFHVADIADAMILGRLFTALFEAGVVVVATSNRPPDDLYKDGLQRSRFVPFIDLLKERLDVLALAGPVDYRLDRLEEGALYHWPLGTAAVEAMDRVFAELTDGAASAATRLYVQSRRIDVPRTAKGVARFSFDELCAKPLGAADYIAIATHFHTVLLDGVPRLAEESRNEAMRFMTLVDELYEHRAKLIVAAETPPERLYAGTTHAFEFERTVSRLMEMRSADYLRLPHLT